MEYQHYIPQFLLRNFSHKFVCPNAEEKQTTGRKGKKCKCRHEKGKFPNDPVLNCINLTTTPLHREVRAVKRVFGLTNMYDDESKPTTAAQRRIEKRFSEMESEASRIIRRMVKAHDAHEQAISLTRIERDFVRKFLFLLKYRGQGYHNRFNHASADKYCADDRNLMVKYMEIHGFKTPLDVWFHSLEAIMDVKMDLQSKWKADLKKIMFPVDAEGFILHIEAYYMAICTPDNPYGEFILTDNCYNIFEGPSSCVRDELTGEIIPSFYAGYHEFAPISPCLIIILRSNLLPNSLEDADPEVRSQRENLRWLAFGQTYGSDNDSLLADLRVHKARASYTRVINGSYHPIQGFDGQYRPNDTFTFPFFPLQARHVTLVNSILLDNAHSCTAIGFRSEEAFFKILESYIAGRSTSLKIIGGLDADLRLRFIERLEGLARDLGSVKPLFICRMGEIPTVDAKGFMRQLERLHGSIWLGEGKDMVSETCGSFVQLYANIENLRIENAFVQFMSDLTQSGRMLHLMAMITIWNLGWRQEALLRSYYRNSSPGRFWLYLKQLKRGCMGLPNATRDFVDFSLDPIWQNGPEDILVKAHTLYPREVLKNLMEVSVMNYLDQNTTPYIKSLWDATFDASTDLPRLLGCLTFVFGRPGAIRDCGIPKLEALACQEEAFLHQHINAATEIIDAPWLDEDETIEILVRMHVKSRFQDAMRGEIDAELLVLLEDVFFELTFPTPPIGSFESIDGKGNRQNE